MHDQPMLTDAEWALIVDLLQQERDELPVEIRHTDTNSVREDLHKRLDMVRSLLGRLETPATV